MGYEILKKSILKDLPQVKTLLNLEEEIRFCGSCPFYSNEWFTHGGCGHSHKGGCLRLYVAGDAKRCRLFMGLCLYFVDFYYTDDREGISYRAEFARPEFAEMLEDLDCKKEVSK